MYNQTSKLNFQLYSILFTAAGRQLTQSGYEQNWIEALRAGLQAVRK